MDGQARLGGQGGLLPVRVVSFESPILELDLPIEHGGIFGPISVRIGIEHMVIPRPRQPPIR